MIAVECVIVTALVVAYGLAALLRLLRRSRPELSVGLPLAVGYVLRIVVIGAISATGIGITLRGGDEIGFLREAHQLAAAPWTSGEWLPFTHQSYLHIIVFAAQVKLLGSPSGALRIAQVGIALTGVLLIVAAVYDIAGTRAARLTAWLLSLELTSLLFNEVLHKEPLMELASGLFVLGATKVWRKIDLRGLTLMGLGALVALETRWYVGWFLMACAVLVLLHASLRQLGSHLRALPAIYAVAGALLIATPALVQATSHESLAHGLQPTVNANATATKGNGGANGNNLALEKVDFSTRGAILQNLPGRIGDVLLRTYPWQVGDLSQTLGAFGTLIAVTCFYLLLRYAWLSRGQVLGVAGPLLYPFLFLLMAYALSVGNAGTGFRYRAHLVTLALAALVVLRGRALECLRDRRTAAGLGVGRGRRPLSSAAALPQGGHGAF